MSDSDGSLRARLTAQEVGSIELPGGRIFRGSAPLEAFVLGEWVDLFADLCCRRGEEIDPLQRSQRKSQCQAFQCQTW